VSINFFNNALLNDVFNIEVVN